MNPTPDRRTDHALAQAVHTGWHLYLGSPIDAIYHLALSGVPQSVAMRVLFTTHRRASGK